MQNRAGPTCEIRSWSTSPFGNSFLEFFRGNFFFSEPPNIFQAALSGPVRMVWSAPVTVGWGAEHSQPLLAGPTCEISSKGTFLVVLNSNFIGVKWEKETLPER